MPGRLSLSLDLVVMGAFVACERYFFHQCSVIPHVIGSSMSVHTSAKSSPYARLLCQRCLTVWLPCLCGRL